jgi:hypothetical protein
VRYMRRPGAETPLQIAMPELRIHARLFRSINSCLLLLLACALLISVSCGSSAPDKSIVAPSTPRILLPAEEVIERSQMTMDALNTFSFELTHEKGATLLPGGFEIHESDGIVSAPDKVALTAKATFSGLFVDIEAVIFPEVTHMTNPFHGDESPFAVFNPPGLISDILSEITTVKFSEGSDSNQHPIKLEGQLPAFAMRNLVGGTDPDKVLSYSMEIDSEFRLLSVELTGVIRTGEAINVQRTIALGDFDVPVTIESPI